MKTFRDTHGLENIMPISRFGDARDWFFQRRFGLFIHWGLYSIGGWHEQEQMRRPVSREDYAKWAALWNPARFDPDSWLDAMQNAGMEYLCLTTKHHDGFCLWPSQFTDFHVGNTPDGRDIVQMVARACEKRGVPLCLYYSVADWKHPNYPNQGRHHELPPQHGDAPDWEKYVDFVRAQVRELCTNYGQISGFWWDMNVPEAVHPDVNALIRELQPSCVINNRGFDEGDFGTPERDFDADPHLEFSRPTEACQSVGVEAWGFRENEDFYSDGHLQRSIARFLARDANYLLNVGPRADGTLPEASLALLRRIGDWYHRVKDAFEGVELASFLTRNREILLTRRQNTLYVVLHREPLGSAVKLAPIAALPTRAVLLNTGEDVECEVAQLPSEWTSGKPCLRLKNLPVNTLFEAMIVRLEFAPDVRFEAAEKGEKGDSQFLR